MSPALADGFLTTEPLEKSLSSLFLNETDFFAMFIPAYTADKRQNLNSGPLDLNIKSLEWQTQRWHFILFKNSNCPLIHTQTPPITLQEGGLDSLLCL